MLCPECHELLGDELRGLVTCPECRTQVRVRVINGVRSEKLVERSRRLQEPQPTTPPLQTALIRRVPFVSLPEPLAGTPGANRCPRCSRPVAAHLTSRCRWNEPGMMTTTEIGSVLLPDGTVQEIETRRVRAIRRQKTGQLCPSCSSVITGRVDDDGKFHPDVEPLPEVAQPGDVKTIKGW